MSSETVGPPGASGAPDPDVESRYQAVCSLDPARSQDLTALLERLADPSWRVRTAAVERLGTLPDPAPALPGLLDALAAGQSPGARSAAAAALTLTGAAAVPSLLERLGSDAPEVRSAVAEVLGEIRDRRAALALSQRLEDPDANVRSAVAEALGKIGGPEAVRALLRAVADGPEAPRLAALDALERLHVAPPMALLAELARDRALRRPAYRLLGLSDDPAGHAILAGGVFERSRSCREAALAAVSQQRLRRSLASLSPLAQEIREAARQNPQAVASTVEALRSDDPGVAAGALRVLGWIGEARHAPAVAAAGEVEDLRPMVLEALPDMGPGIHAALAESLPRLSPGARITALSALARLGDASVLDPLVEALTSEYDAVRDAAIDGLARLGDLRAVPRLGALLDHPERGASAAAAAALATIASRGEPERLRVLEHCRAPEGHPPAALLRLLGQIGDARDVATVRASFEDPRPSTRAAAAAGLQALGARGLVSGDLPDLVGALGDPVPAVRAAAAQALGTLAQPAHSGSAGLPLGDEAARELAAALHDGEPLVQVAAAQAVGRCRLVHCREALMELATSAVSPPEVVAAAIRSLAELGQPDAAVLERATRHSDPEVVKEAVAAAAGMPAAATSELLLAAAAHPRWDVRRAAARAVAARGDRSLLDAVRRLAAVEEDPLVGEALAEALRALEAR